MQGRPRLFPRGASLLVLAPIACTAIPGAAAHAGLLDRCTVSDAVLDLPSGPYGLFGAFQSVPAPSQAGDCGAVVYSAAFGSTLALAELLRRGADPNSRSELGVTALMAAVFHGQTGATQLLLAQRGIDVNEMTPVHWDFSIHIEGSHPLRTGARTALMYAAAGGQVEAIQLLLAHGARADQTDAEGHTALDYSRSNPAREALISGTRRN